jgi:radical SAM protein with 4Fe4S-binding SPASM domain
MMLGNKKNIINRYEDQNYTTLFNKETGYFARIEDSDVSEPLWSHHGPELIDVSITNWCDKGCSFCYRKSNVLGKLMPITDYEFIIKQAHELDVLQVAIGGGNPNQHPDFIRILELTNKYDIVPCYTTNGRGLSFDILTATKELCGAVAISAYEPYDELERAIEKLCKYGIKTNVHFLINSQSIDTAIEWLKNPPGFLDEINSVIFLSFKPIGRNPDASLLLKDHRKLQIFYGLIQENKRFNKIGFDSCSVSGVVRYLNVNPCFYEGCDAGRFSAFIDEDLKMFPCSFMNNTNGFGDLRKMSMIDIWLDNPYFQNNRDRIINNSCVSCKYQNVCLGGCPFINELSQCGWKDERLQKELC